MPIAAGVLAYVSSAWTLDTLQPPSCGPVCSTNLLYPATGGRPVSGHKHTRSINLDPGPSSSRPAKAPGITADQAWAEAHCPRLELHAGKI